VYIDSVTAFTFVLVFLFDTLIHSLCVCVFRGVFVVRTTGALVSRCRRRTHTHTHTHTRKRRKKERKVDNNNNNKQQEKYKGNKRHLNTTTTTTTTTKGEVCAVARVRIYRTNT
jgi:hypothetical protein